MIADRRPPANLRTAPWRVSIKKGHGSWTSEAIMRSNSGVLILLALMALTPASSPAEEDGSVLVRYEQVQPHMGTQFGISLYAPDEETARKAFNAAFARIGELDERMSDYDATSELSQLSQASPTTEPVKLSDDLWRVLSASQELSRRSRGAFDVTVGPLTQLWRRARRQKELPDENRLEAALAAVGYQHLRLDAEHRAAELVKPKMRLDLGGIAKGFAGDEALKAMARHGVTRAIVNGGGGLSLGDAPPGEKGWKVGVAPLEANAQPSRVLLLANCGIATSGDAWQYVEIGGVRYSHIVDPRTGLGLTRRSSVTVVTESGTLADGLATAASVLGPEKGLELIQETSGAAGLFVWVENDEVKSTQTANFAELPLAEPGEDR
jgi:thiamine biosynthesis lipoprotein